MKKIPLEAIKKRLITLNDHWKTEEVGVFYTEMKERRYIDRFFPLLQKSVKRAVILMGPRRVGKTVMLWHCISRLIKSGTKAQDIFYVSLDLPILHSLSLEEILDIFTEIISVKSLDGKIIFFDEIQYLKNWDTHLKVLVDQYKKTTFIASGSAAGALSRKSKESGAGRFSDFLLPPLTFYEYLDLLNLYDELITKTEYSNEKYSFYKVSKNEIKEQPRYQYQSSDLNQLNKEFINYINYGGFPEALFQEDIRNDPDRYLRSDIIDKVLLRDLPSLYGISDTQELNRLFTTLAFQTGNEVTLDGISKASGVAKNTVKKYIEYLEAAFLIKTVRRVDEHGKNFKRNNFFKVYLTNPSFYSALFGSVNEDDTELLGHLVETAIYSQWFHSPNTMRQIFYARWPKSEVDIVHKGFGNKINWAIEVKWSDLFYENQNKLKKFYKFCSDNSIRVANVTTRNTHNYRKLDDVTYIEFIPAACYCLTVGINTLKHPS